MASARSRGPVSRALVSRGLVSRGLVSSVEVSARSAVLEWGRERARVGRWRGDGPVALLSPANDGPLPSASFVQRCLERLADDGYTSVVTPALTPVEQTPFLAAGFEEQERLRLLTHDLSHLAPVPDVPLRRALDGDWPPVLTRNRLAGVASRASWSDQSSRRQKGLNDAASTASTAGQSPSRARRSGTSGTGARWLRSWVSSRRRSCSSKPAARKGVCSTGVNAGVTTDVYPSSASRSRQRRTKDADGRGPSLAGESSATGPSPRQRPTRARSRPHSRTADRADTSTEDTRPGGSSPRDTGLRGYGPTGSGACHQAYAGHCRATNTPSRSTAPAPRGGRSP